MNKNVSQESILHILLRSIIALFFLPFWHAEKLIKRKSNEWVFGAWRGERYADNTRVLFEYVLRNHPEIKVTWLTKNPIVYQRLHKNGMPVEMVNSVKGVKACLRAQYFFICWSVLDGNALWMNGQKIMQLWHGMPLKIIGTEEWRIKRGKITFFKCIKTAFRRFAMPYEFLSYEMTLSTSDLYSNIMSKAFNLPKERVWQLGLPRNDYLLNPPAHDNLITQINQSYHNPIVYLYLPTWRESFDDANMAFNPFTNCDLELLNSVLEQKNAVLLYKGHFLGTDNAKAIRLSRIITITDNDYDDLYTLMHDVDILITDYSSVYIDFIVTKKPIILFPFDQAEYLRNRPLNFEFSKLQAYKVYSWTELIRLIGSEVCFHSPSQEEITMFNNFTTSDVCQRLCERVLMGINYEK